jgi:hypothetical protein
MGDAAAMGSQYSASSKEMVLKGEGLKSSAEGLSLKKAVSFREDEFKDFPLAQMLLFLKGSPYV